MCTRCTQTVQKQRTVLKALQTFYSGVHGMGENGKTLIETQSLEYPVYTDCPNTANCFQSSAILTVVYRVQEKLKYPN